MATDLESLRPLMSPSSIAVVGASPKGNRGSFILRNLRRFNYRGKVYAVNPRCSEVEGIPCYPSLKELPEPVEFVAVAVNTQHVVEVMRQAGGSGVKAGLVIASGFGEGSGKGKAVQQELNSVCAEYGIKICGPNCYGILNVHQGTAPYSGGIVNPLVPGNIGFVLQSGAMTRSMHDSAIGRGMGISYIVTSGNEAVVELSEYLDWLVEDRNTKVIVAYIEGLKNPARFAAVAEKALLRGKTIIALKVGRSEKGKEATLAHTGSVAGSEASYEALFQKYGVVRVNDIDELIEAALLFSSPRRLAGDGFAVASISGGLCSLVSDLAEEIGLKLPALGDVSNQLLNECLPHFGVASNPLDATGAAAEDPATLARAVSAIAQDPGISSVAVVFNTPQSSADSRSFFQNKARLIAELQETTAKPLVAFSAASGPVDPGVLEPLQKAGIPFLTGTRESLLGLKSWSWYSAKHRMAASGASQGRIGSGKGLVKPGSWTAGSVLAEREAKELLSLYGIPVARQELAASSRDAVAASMRIGFPVALKIDSPDLPHKTEAGGVKLGLHSPEEVAEAYEAIMVAARAFSPTARLMGVLVQQMAPPGVEVLLGVTRDSQFGLQVAVGLGGIFVEMLRSVALRPVPLSERDVQEMIDSIPLAKMLSGFRGRGPADRTALVDAVLTVSDLAADLNKALDEIDVNPLVVLPLGQGVKALDALVVFSSKGGEND